MKNIAIKYHESTGEYSFKCPYCKMENILPDVGGCDHYVFGYESINEQPLDMADFLSDAITDKLSNHKTKGPEMFQEVFADYKPEYDSPSEYDADEYDSARQEAIEQYMEQISMDDVLWFLDRMPEFKGYISHSTLAVLDDGEGNETSYLYMDDEMVK